MTTDKNGKPYAKLSELKAGDLVELDDGFDCAKGQQSVGSTWGRLYFHCSHGLHFLDGQADNGEDCIGIYRVQS